MDKVFVVFQGAKYEGQDMKGIFSTRAAAYAKVAELCEQIYQEEKILFVKDPEDPNRWDAAYGAWISIETHRVD